MWDSFLLITHTDYIFIFCILVAVTMFCNVDCNENGICSMVDNIGLCICYTGKFKNEFTCCDHEKK